MGRGACLYIYGIAQATIGSPRLRSDFRGMPRAYRLHAPGAGTHITARLQGGAALFTETLRDSVASLICEAAQFTGVHILALVVMPNHFHIVDVDTNYHAFLDYAKVRYLTAVPGDRLLYDWSGDWCRPRAPKGDEHWIETYSHAVPQRHVLVQKRDLRDRAVDILKSIAPHCSLDDVRSCNRSRKIVQIRRDLIAVLLTSGYRGSAIARCLFVSAALVSRVAADIKYGQRQSA